MVRLIYLVSSLSLSPPIMIDRIKNVVEARAATPTQRDHRVCICVSSSPSVYIYIYISILNQLRPCDLDTEDSLLIESVTHALRRILEKTSLD